MTYKIITSNLTVFQGSYLICNFCQLSVLLLIRYIKVESKKAYDTGSVVIVHIETCLVEYSDKNSPKINHSIYSVLRI
jgi:hypothetical protein